MEKCSYQSNHEISLASSHFSLFAFSHPINWVKYINLETLRKETENLEMRKNMRTLPHTTTERKAERWLYSWEDCQRDHHTHKKETITGYLHSAFFMTFVFFQGGEHMYWSCLIMSPLKGWPSWCSYTYLPGKCWGYIPECIFFVTQLMRGNVVKLGLYLFCCWCSSSCAFS